MGKNNILINGRSVVTEKSKGIAVAFPDVCKTPSPAGPIPVPYPNVSKSADLSKGTKTIQIEGAAIMIRGSEFSTSTGDEPGSLGGVISGKTKGKAVPISYSFDVKFEGKLVVRNFDLVISNDMNTPPTPIIQKQVLPTQLFAQGDKNNKEEEKEEIVKCEYCKEDQHVFSEKGGNNMGSGTLLIRSIFAGRDKKDHPWFTGPRSLQAHHLVCSEALANPKYAELCRKFGYDINHKSNGVMLPNSMQMACQLHVPLHRGHHASGEAGSLAYPARIKKLVFGIIGIAVTGGYCDDSDQFVDDLNSLSEFILSKVSKFHYTLTADGRDYMFEGCGCAGVSTLKNKVKVLCPNGRNHDLKQESTGVVILAVREPLKIGE